MEGEEGDWSRGLGPIQQAYELYTEGKKTIILEFSHIGVKKLWSCI